MRNTPREVNRLSGNCPGLVAGCSRRRSFSGPNSAPEAGPRRALRCSLTSILTISFTLLLALTTILALTTPPARAAVPNVTGTYTGSGTETSSNCQDASSNGFFQFSASVTIPNQTGGSFSGTTTLSANFGGINFVETDQFSGTVTETGALSGSFTYVLRADGAFDSSGVGTFTGQLSGNSLTTNSSGRDTVGDTCTFTGTFSGVRPAPDPVPVINLSPTSVTIDARKGSSAAQTVTVTNSGGGSLSGLGTSVTYGGGQPTGWLTASFNNTTAPATLTLRANAISLSAGTYNATVTVNASGASPRNVAVSFVVAQPNIMPWLYLLLLDD